MTKLHYAAAAGIAATALALAIPAMASNTPTPKPTPKPTTQTVTLALTASNSAAGFTCALSGAAARTLQVAPVTAGSSTTRFYYGCRVSGVPAGDTVLTEMDTPGWPDVMGGNFAAEEPTAGTWYILALSYNGPTPQEPVPTTTGDVTLVLLPVTG